MSDLPGPLRQVLPAYARASATQHWWENTSLVLRLFGELASAAFGSLDLGDGWSKRETPSRPPARPGVAWIHDSAVILPGAVLMGDVVICADCEIGPNCTIFGPTVIGPGSYVGPGAEIRRSAIFSRLTLSHVSYLGHSVVGHRVNLAAGFLTAVRNLRRPCVHILAAGVARNTGHEHFGAIIADDFYCRINTEVMPGRLLVQPRVDPDSIP